MKIGFFGDSFCADLQSGTYLQLLAIHYGADVVHVGSAGSSIWDVLLLQIDPFIKNNNIPDICVFVWTEQSRLFHRVLRNITTSSAFADTWRSTGKSNEIIYEAARVYYLHLHNTELDQYRFTAALHYFDTVILPTFPNNTKIVHLWSFGVEQGICHPFHTWKNGVEIHPSVASIIVDDQLLVIKWNEVMPKEMYENVYNHVPFGKKFDLTNSLIFNLIKDAIDQQ